MSLPSTKHHRHTQYGMTHTTGHWHTQYWLTGTGTHYTTLACTTRHWHTLHSTSTHFAALAYTTRLTHHTERPHRRCGGQAVQKSRDRIRRITLLICNSHLNVQVALAEYCPVKGGGNGQSIGSTVTDAIGRSWLLFTATGSCQLGYFSGVTANS